MQVVLYHGCKTVVVVTFGVRYCVSMDLEIWCL